MIEKLLIILIGLILMQCSTGVNRSPEPGIVKVVLQSEPSDTTIVILNETYSVDSNSVFLVQVAQGKVYIDSFYSDILPELDDFKDTGNRYNILEQEDGTYKKTKLFETYAPPDNYNNLQFALNASVLKIAEFQIPVQLPEGAQLLMDFEFPFTVKERMTTEIFMQIEPLSSVIRYKDSYIFIRKIEILNITYY